MKLSIVIPVYNEINTFEPLIKKVLSVKLNLKKEIIVVEGGSNDGTKELVDKFKNEEEIKIFHLNKYSGKGYKVKYGLRRVTGDIILIQDADLEYNPEEYPELIKPITNGETNFVLGSRHLGKKTWKIRQFDYSKSYGQLVNMGSEVLNGLFYLLYRAKLTDPQTMYKVFKRECLQGVKLRSNNFQLDWELVIKLVKKGFIPKEVPVSYKARTKEEGKKINLWRDGILALWVILKYRFVN